MATLRDVAKAAKVSLSTASRVINGYKNVNEETRKRVLAVVRDLNYQYVYREHSRKNITIAVLLSKNIGFNLSQHPTVNSITIGIAQQCSEEKIMNTVLLIDMAHLDTESFFSRKMDAYIFVGTSQQEEDAMIPLLRRHKLPFVVVNRWLEDRHISYVNVDDYSTIRELTLQMIDRGFLKLGFVNGLKEMRNSVQRLDGFVSACRERRLPLHDEWIFHGEYDEAHGYKTAEMIASQEERPNLILTSSDIIAIGLIKGLISHGIRVPEDISVIGFGDVPMAAYFQPPLTTVRIPTVELGVEALKAALRLIENPSIHHIKLAMDCEMFERGTTLPFPQ